MAAFSDYLEEALLDHTLQGRSANALTGIEIVYLALFTTDPTDAGTGTEATGTGYARVTVDSSSTDEWTVADQGAGQWTAVNINALTFPTAGGSWGTVTHVGIFDALTTGNLLYHGALNASRAIASGEAFEFEAGDLDIELQ